MEPRGLAAVLVFGCVLGVTACTGTSSGNGWISELGQDEPPGPPTPTATGHLVQLSMQGAVDADVTTARSVVCTDPDGEARAVNIVLDRGGHDFYVNVYVHQTPPGTFEVAETYTIQVVGYPDTPTTRIDNEFEGWVDQGVGAGGTLDITADLSGTLDADLVNHAFAAPAQRTLHITAAWTCDEPTITTTVPTTR